MVKEILKKQETIAYLSLKNDLNTNHIAHSYLFCGEANPLKKETAFLLAQSIIEGKNDFACEECDTCKRIKDGNYFDLIYIDGYKEIIKKEHIERIMEEFSRTSLESANKKIYIIDNINNSSTKVLNMILKFMEEPSGSDIYGIFITDNVDTLLETVVSRCKKISFLTRDFSYLISEYESKGFSYINSYLLSKITHELKDINTDDEAFINAKEFVYKTIENFDDKKYIPILYSREFYKSVNKDDFKVCSDYYLDIFSIMIDDAISNCNVNDDEYMFYVNRIKKENITKLMNIILDAKAKTNIAINRQLLFDQIAAKIIL